MKGVQFMARFHREVTKSWTVQYEEMSFPAVQKGWVLPPDNWKLMDPFILLAEDWFKRGTFSDHPHRGFQTLTYVIDGRLEHIDNQGGHGILEAGDVQYMNAGKGARHGEEAVDQDIAHTLQLWLNLPDKLRTTDASYQDVYLEDVPVKEFEGGHLRVYGGNLHGLEGPLQSLVPITLTEVSLAKGASFTHHLPENYNGFIYMLSGDVTVGKNEVQLKKTGVGHLSYKRDGNEGMESDLSIRANAKSKALIYSGKPIKEEIIAHGPFVMGTMEEIKQAYADFREGKFGPPAIN